MNERIKLLALQAGITDNNLSDGDMSLTDLEKFSELIVRECAKLCSDPVVILQHWGIDSKSE
jgi:hypothetical protein